MKLGKRPVILAVAIGAALTIAACTYPFGGSRSAQGWTEKQRASWYWASQGSRLMPAAWFDALERTASTEKFADPSHLAGFGFVLPPAGSDISRPIGFAKDIQADEGFPIGGMSWYEGQSHTKRGAEAWVGLNCSACHTARISYQGTATTIDGGPNLLDFQGFVESLDDALKATQSDPAKWERFAAEVLAGKDTPANRDMLTDAFDTLLAWQIKTDRMNETPLRYGFGRLDAVGHIFNKVLMFNGADGSRGNPSNAPVSYPFVWDIWRQDRVQWNGIARNSRFQLPGDSFEYGALGRNTGEVLGVFGEVIVEGPGGLTGFRSTVQTENLVELELILQKLRAPVWPDHFPAIDEARAARGAELFKQKCASCHLTPDMQKEGEPTEVMVTFEETMNTNSRDLTDIWMACNAFVYRGPTGPMRGMKDADDVALGAEAEVANMLAVAVKGSLFGDKEGLVNAAVKNFFGVRRPPVIVEALPADRVAENRRTCLTTSNPLLAYKARPLDGIWATAPYLHNGSVANLYDLLLPAEERQGSFWVGSREFDPQKVGYVTTQPDTGGFLLRTRNSSGAVIEGNSNAGHEYGARALTEDMRLDLVEYMKTL